MNGNGVTKASEYARLKSFGANFNCERSRFTWTSAGAAALSDVIRLRMIAGAKLQVSAA